MGKIITLPFEYKGKGYTLLIREKKENQSFIFSVTAITEDLESKLYGNHIFRWNGESIVAVIQPAMNPPDTELKERIAFSLKQYILLSERY